MARHFCRLRQKVAGRIYLLIPSHCLMDRLSFLGLWAIFTDLLFSPRSFLPISMEASWVLRKVEKDLVPYFSITILQYRMYVCFGVGFCIGLDFPIRRIQTLKKVVNVLRPSLCNWWECDLATTSISFWDFSNYGTLVVKCFHTLGIAWISWEWFAMHIFLRLPNMWLRGHCEKNSISIMCQYDACLFHSFGHPIVRRHIRWL